MKSEKLLYAIGMIEESMIEEAAPKTIRTEKKHGLLKYLMPAATCAAIALFAIFVLPQISKTPNNNTPGRNNSVIPGQQTDKNNETNSVYVKMNIVMNELRNSHLKQRGILVCFGTTISR